jgi:hypothetical protein
LVEIDRNSRHDVSHSRGTHKHRFNIFRVHLCRASLAV